MNLRQKTELKYSNRPYPQETTMMNYTKATIKNFLLDSLHYDLQDDEDLVALGFAKSLFVLQLILFVERTFDIKIENVPHSINSFRTVNTITALVDRKLAYVSED